MKTVLHETQKIWHTHFADEQHHYSEFEDSDIEYFLAVLLYNQFQFSKAVKTMQTIEIAKDFLDEAGEYFQEVQSLLQQITFNTEEDAAQFLLDFIIKSQESYDKNERYLLDRMYKHIYELNERYTKDITPEIIDFEAVHNKLHPALRGDNTKKM